MVGVEEAKQSKLELLKEVEKAAAEVKTSRKALEDALLRVGKLAVEEALRRWRSEQGQRSRHVHSSPKLKNSQQTHHRRDSRMLDLNGRGLVTDVPRTGIRPPLLIGQILSRKLMGPEEYDLVEKLEKTNAKPKVSLGQMLSKKHGALSPQRAAEGDGYGSARKQYSAKRKKFALVSLSLLKTKQSMKARKSKKAREA